MNGGSELLRVRTEDIAWREIDGSVVILDLRENRYLSVDATGIVAWNRLGRVTRGDLAAEIAETFAVDRARAKEDLDAFLESLRSAGLLLEPGA